MVRVLTRDEHDFARLDRVQHLREFREKGLQEAKTVTVCHENDDRQTQPGEILLKDEAPVHGDQNVILGVRSTQQLAVQFALPANAAHRMYGPASQLSADGMRNTLVQQHPRWNAHATLVRNASAAASRN